MNTSIGNDRQLYHLISIDRSTIVQLPFHILTVDCICRRRVTRPYALGQAQLMALLLVRPDFVHQSDDGFSLLLLLFTIKLKSCPHNQTKQNCHRMKLREKH